MLWKQSHPLLADLAAPPPPLVFIDDQAASNVAQIDIAWALDFERVHVLVSDLDPVTANVDFRMRTSSDGGATFDAGATDYRYTASAFAVGLAGITSNGDSLIQLTDDLTDLQHSGAFLVTVHRPSDTGLFTAIHSFGGYGSASATVVQRGTAWRNAAGRVDALRFFMPTGNINNGRFFAWGEMA